MILNNAIIDDIKQKSNLLFDKAGDFDLLSGYIFKSTGRTIGITTLKRLFSYIKDDRKASEYTLNTIASYLGYDSWEVYATTKNVDSEWGFQDTTVYVHALEVGTKLTIKYLNRIVSFEVVENKGQNVLKVISSENSSLKQEDLLYVYRIRIGEVLEAEKVIRGNVIGNYRTKQEISDIQCD